jgi:aerobic carbon-monoxide dehydrogenase medium subunit
VARPRLPCFNYLKVESADDAVAVLKIYGNEARLLLGGTDLLNQMREGKASPKVLIDVKGLPGMQSIIYQKTMGLTIGAAATMNRIANDPCILSHYKLLAEAASSVASYQLRSRATIGGNLCNASPCADITPATLVLDGCLVVYGQNGSHEIPASDFHKGPGKTSLDPYEILTAIKFPLSPVGSIGHYYKLGRNKFGDLAIVSVAILGYPQNTTPLVLSFG